MLWRRVSKPKRASLLIVALLTATICWYQFTWMRSFTYVIPSIPTVLPTNRPARRLPRIQTSQEFVNNAPNAVILVYPHTEYGLLCNNLHQISSAIDLALSFPPHDNNTVLAIAFEKKMGDLVRASVDVEYIQFMLDHSRDLNRFRGLLLTPQFEFYPGIQLLLDWNDNEVKFPPSSHHHVFTLSPKRFQQKYGDAFSFTLTFFIQPNKALRQQAEDFIISHRSKNLLLSVHRRNFAWCKPTYRKYSPFCSSNTDASRIPWDQRRYFDDDCNVTWTPQLALKIRETWPELDDKKEFSIFLASDLHDKVGDLTFPSQVSIPHQENEEHYIAEELLRKILAGQPTEGSLKRLVKERTGLDMNWDLSMLVDMWAQVLVKYSIGQPWSSCDRILAMWKSKYSRAAFQAYTSFNNDDTAVSEFGSMLEAKYLQLSREDGGGSGSLRTFPIGCYGGFESPKSAQDAMQVTLQMRRWWIEIGLKHLPTSKTDPAYAYDNDSVETIPVKFVRLK